MRIALIQMTVTADKAGNLQTACEKLREAAAQVLSDTPPTMTRQLRLQLVRSESGWQVVLNQPLRQLLSGFVAE